MASITLDNATMDFPIYGLQKSFRKVLFSRVVGGTIAQESNNKRVYVRALSRLTIKLKDGDRLGLIGHNGAGKTTLLRTFAGIYEPSSGVVAIEGRVSTLFTTSPGLDFEDTGYENIYTCGMYLGMSRQEIAAKMADIEEFSELGGYLSLPVRTYSAGMVMRLGFAVATAIDPEILVLDEGLSAGDARFTTKARARMHQLVRRAQILILASHSDTLISDICNRVLLLNHGEIIADGPPAEIIAKYKEMSAAGAQNAKAAE